MKLASCCHHLCNSYSLRTNSGDNYSYILQLIINYDKIEITFVRKFFVQKARNHNYGNSFEFQVHEIIIRSVQLVGYSP